MCLVSIHGLIRANEPELGRDPDTGGQVAYVLDLARTASVDPTFSRVEVLTRKVIDKGVSPDYCLSQEKIPNSNAEIVRLRCGPNRYIRKELLWPYLDEYVDRCLAYFRSNDSIPDVIHTHYADAGYVGMQLSSMLGIAHVHTGHSLGRVKRSYLRSQGTSERQIERQFRLQRRIEVEEELLDSVSLTIASTKQEIEEQYGSYASRRKNRIAVIPPGLDLDRFYPPKRGFRVNETLREEVEHFLRHPGKPMILAIARADPRKNLSGLIEAYANHLDLKDSANLVIVAGNRDDLNKLEDSQAMVLRELIELMDRYDLYGRLSLPKHHLSEDVPELFRLAAKRRGVFVNPAITEGFGLTLIEAAASGLPTVATDDGGPREIAQYLHNGVLVDASDTKEIAKALYQVISSTTQWSNWARSGSSGVKRHYSWEAHERKYSNLLHKVVHSNRKVMRNRIALLSGPNLIGASKLIALDIDDTLIGNENALANFLQWLDDHKSAVAFAVATGRRANSAKKVLIEHSIPLPDVFISSVGSEIHYGSRLQKDLGWRTHISHQWRRDDLKALIGAIEGLTPQSRYNQGEHKISYNVDLRRFPGIQEVAAILRSNNLRAHLVYSHQKFLDVLPARASKGNAIRYLSYKWGIPLNRMLTAGNSGNDEEMLGGVTLGVVVGNHSVEINHLKGRPKVYFAKQTFANGILEGIEHFGFDNL